MLQHLVDSHARELLEYFTVPDNLASEPGMPGGERTARPPFRYWRIKTIDRVFEDRRWTVVSTKLFDAAGREVTGRLMASSVIGTAFSTLSASEFYVPDGIWGATWSANYGENDWYGVDLGEPGRAVTRLAIRQYARQHGSNHFEVQCSHDRVTWETVKTVHHPVSNREEELTYTW
jgi:hypothetical protein